MGGGTVAPTGLRIMTDQGPAPADFSCLNQRNAPAPGADQTVTLTANAFGQVDAMANPIVVPGLEIQLFAGNAIPADTGCGANCMLATDNGDGSYTVDAPSDAWLAYRVIERAEGPGGPAVLRTVETNFTPSPEEGFNSIFEPVLDGLHNALGIARDTTATLVAGRVLDCNGDFVEGARIAVRDVGGNSVPVTITTRPIYIDTMGPDPSLTETTFAGQWSFTNVPLSGGQVAVEVRAENDVLVGCELAATASDAMSVARVGPLRADGPTACDP